MDFVSSIIKFEPPEEPDKLPSIGPAKKSGRRKIYLSMSIPQMHSIPPGGLIRTAHPSLTGLRTHAISRSAQVSTRL